MTTTTKVQLKWVPGDALRIFFYDAADPGALVPTNITQGVDIDIGADTIELDADSRPNH